jgi:hypothetical protein
MIASAMESARVTLTPEQYYLFQQIETQRPQQSSKSLAPLLHLHTH